MSNVPATDEQDRSAEKRLRRKARFRSFFIPGAGFAVYGRKRLGWLGVLLLWAWIFAAAVFGFFACAISFGSLLGVTAAVLLFWVFETVALPKAKIAPSAPVFLSRWFLPVCLLSNLGLIASVGIIVAMIRPVHISGTGMAPTLPDGDWALYSRHFSHDHLIGGAAVVFREPSESKPPNAARLLIGRILACPGDKIAADEEHYFVNGVPGPPILGPDRIFSGVPVPDVAAPLVVPEDKYFVVQDNPQAGADSRTLSWVSSSDVLGVGLLRIGRLGFGREVK